MKDLLTTLLAHLKATTAQTRLVIGVGMMLLVGAAGVMTYRGANPHMVPGWTGLDNAEFSAVTNALATAGIRFEANSGSSPYVVFVPSGELHAAWAAVASNSALDVGPKGINPAGGAKAIFDGADKRMQETRKRDWQDLEMQLETFSFVQSAVVRAAGLPPSPFTRNAPQTVSVVLHLRGALSLDAGQRRAVASVVRNGANVPDENITISDQHGTLLFDGTDDQTLDEFLRFENEWADHWTARAQDQLDVMFGPGLSKVHVSGEFDFALTESVNETYDPQKMTVSDETLDTTTPVDVASGAPAGGAAGGPAGLQANLQGSTPPAASTSEATVTESSKRYVYGKVTTHTQAGAPVLERITVSLALHESLETRLLEAESLVKGLVRFDEERDEFASAALPLVGVQLDDQGQPVLPTVEPPPAPPSRMTTLLIERGVELLAAAAFLFVLVRSLRKGTPKEQPIQGEVAPAGVSAVPEEELDLDLLARKHVEQMLDEDPEKVAALLSRWALGENFYAGSKS